MFGFARSYFMVYAPLPAALVEWLREILPGKTTAELYMAIGCQKHAKRKVIGSICSTVNCDEQFIEAPGIRGMVMLVFTLPGFDRVFKIIKDKFAPQKRCLPPTSAPVINWSKSTIVWGGWLTPVSSRILCWINGKSIRR